MEDKINKIIDKVEYEDNDIQAQSCTNDCGITYTNQSWVDMTGHVQVVGGSAIVAICSRHDCRETPQDSASGWSYW